MNKLLIFLLSLCVTSLEAATITNWGAQLPTAVPASGDAILMQKGGVTYYFTPNQLAVNIATNANSYDRSNVRWWGAIPDDGVDDTSTIQAALNSAVVPLANYGSESIRLPRGLFEISSTLYVTNQGVTFEGTGAESILYYTGTGPAIVMGCGNPSTTDKINIRNLSIIVASGTQVGIDVGSGVDKGVIEGVIIRNPSTGIYLRSNAGTTSNFRISDCEINPLLGAGIYADTCDSLYIGPMNFIHGQLPMNSVYGVITTNGSSVIISGNTIEQCFMEVLVTGTSRSTTVADNYTEGAQLASFIVKVSGTATSTTIRDNYMQCATSNNLCVLVEAGTVGTRIENNHAFATSGLVTNAAGAGGDLTILNNVIESSGGPTVDSYTGVTLFKHTTNSFFGNGLLQLTNNQIGVGTTPDNKLSVYDATAKAQALFNGHSAWNGRTHVDSGSIQIGGAANFHGQISYSGASLTDLTLENTYDNAGAIMQFRMRTAGTPVTAMTILGSGNVGIGTTTPLDKLHVVGGIVQTNGGIWQTWSLAAPSAPATQGAVYWNDGTNICAVFRNAGGALSTNKLSMSAWP